LEKQQEPRRDVSLTMGASRSSWQRTESHPAWPVQFLTATGPPMQVW